MNSKVVIIALCAGMIACQSNQVRTTNPMVKESKEHTDFIAFGLQRLDFEYAARRAVDQFLESGWFQKHGGQEREWIVMMGEVINDTTFNIDTASMTSRLKQYLVRTGHFAFTAAIGQEATQTVRDYRQLEKSRLFDQSTGSARKAVKPDLEMLGVIRQRTNVSPNRKEQQLEYEFDFRVVDLGSGLERFQAFIPIEKVGSNKNFAW